VRTVFATKTAAISRVISSLWKPLDISSSCDEYRGPWRCSMNAVERVLDDDVSRLLDRVAASVPGGCLEAMVGQTPTLRRRLDEVELQVAGIRAALLEGYGRWRRALEDVENLWALVAWRAVAPDLVVDPSAAKETSEEPPSLA